MLVFQFYFSFFCIYEMSFYWFLLHFFIIKCFIYVIGRTIPVCMLCKTFLLMVFSFYHKTNLRVVWVIHVYLLVCLVNLVTSVTKIIFVCYKIVKSNRQSFGRHKKEIIIHTFRSNDIKKILERIFFYITFRESKFSF